MNNKLAAYVETFNRNDEELTRQAVDNAHALEWMQREVPLFECPDPVIEETYYFRWWVFRKHIKHTPEGRIITEFLPSVPWAGPHNSINCAVGHHLAEARWLKHDRALAEEYVRFWFRGSGDAYAYSCWIVDAVYEYACATGDFALATALLPDFEAFYARIERDHMTPYGLFWSYDDRDAMELSISGSGLRPTLNSYMYANASAIAAIAMRAGRLETAKQYSAKAEALRKQMNALLWDRTDGFYKVIPQDRRDDEIEHLVFDRVPAARNAMEAIGYIPWSFGIPNAEQRIAWRHLQDTAHFAAPFGPTTADQSHSRYRNRDSEHECQWNGPSWPFATTQVLNGMIRALTQGEDSLLTCADFLRVLYGYANSHYRVREDGLRVNWLDENLDPDTGEWLSRRILRDWGWREDKGGYERGKDYNHSAFCDVVIRGLCGVSFDASDTLRIAPLLPNGAWPYFRLMDLPIKGHKLTIVYDSDGTHYASGRGLRAELDGHAAGATDGLCPLFLTL